MKILKGYEYKKKDILKKNKCQIVYLKYKNFNTLKTKRKLFK